MHRCPNCGHTYVPPRRRSGLAIVALVAWMFPLAFAAQGYWPFFLLPAIALTVWAWLDRRGSCPRCGTPAG